MPAPRPTPSAAQKRHSRRAAWKGGRGQPLSKIVAVYLTDRCRRRLRRMAAANAPECSAHDLASIVVLVELELVREELVREINEKGIMLEYPDGGVKDNPAIGHLLRISKTLGYTAEAMHLTGRESWRGGKWEAASRLLRERTRLRNWTSP